MEQTAVVLEEQAERAAHSRRRKTPELLDERHQAVPALELPVRPPRIAPTALAGKLVAAAQVAVGRSDRIVAAPA